MNIVDISQRSDEWHHWRAQGVAASDAAIILGESPYKTRWRLWAEKTGLVTPEDLSGNPNIQRGMQLEPKARAAYECKHQTLLLPLCGEAAHNPLLRASFDGINDDGEPVELKCPTESVFKDVLANGKNSDTYRLYLPQVMHQINVAGSQSGTLVFFYQDQLIEFEIQRDDQFISEMEEQEIRFWQQIQTLSEPEKDPFRDIFKPPRAMRPVWCFLAQRYRNIRSAMDELESQLTKYKNDVSDIQSALSDLMGDFAHAEYGGLKLTRYWVRGAVNHHELLQARLPDLTEPEIEQYRKPAQQRVRISLTADSQPAQLLEPSAALISAPSTDNEQSTPSTQSFYF